MKRNYKVIFIILGITAVLWSFVPKQEKSDNEKNVLLVKMITYLLERGHYDPVKINDSFSKDVYKEYLKSLDPTKRFFIQSDIDEFSKYEDLIDDMIQLEDLSFFNLTEQRIVQRMEEARDIYREILSKPFDFSKEEEFSTDFDKQDYAADEVDLKNRWKKQLKLNILSKIYDRIKIQEEGKEEEDKVKEDKTVKPDKLGDKDKASATLTEKEGKKEEIKSFEEIEKEARESTLKSYDEYFDIMKDVESKDWFSIYLNAIVERFDPHTFYFAPDDKEKFDESMKGSIEGIGAVLKKKNDITEISELIPGGPAWRGKELEQGDLILKVAQGSEDPVDVVGMRLENVVKQIKGKKGTVVNLTVKKIDGTVKVISITREVIELEETYAKSTIIKKGDKKYGLIQLPKFYINFKEKDNRNAFTDVAKEIEYLKGQKVDGIVMDLRNNGGGSLQTVVDMVGLFIGKGPVVQVKSGKAKKDILSYKSSDIRWDGPLVVLVNNFSASASEIFAAAIQDYNRGIVIGSKHTFGKGTVQNLIDLNEMLKTRQPYGDLGALKITLQKFYRVNGGSTQKEGVLSDIVLPDRYYYIDMGERDLDNAMPWDKIDEANYIPFKNNFQKAIANSKVRIAKNEQFELINQNAKWINERKDQNTYPLNFDKYKAKQKEIEEKAKKFKSISKYNNNLEFESLPHDLEKTKIDTLLEKKRIDWHEVLGRDIYVEEAINVLKDIENNPLAQPKL